MRTRIALLVTLLVSVLALAGCGGGGGAVKIAIVAPMSGDVSTFGVSTRDGAMLAINEYNEAGGVLGREIEVIVEDSQCLPEPAVSAANKVIDQDGVKFIIGEVCSSASIPISEIVTQKGVLQISPTSTNPSVTVNEDGSTKDTVFRACFIDPFQGAVAAKFALDNLGAQTAAVFLDQGNDYVRGLAEVFIEQFEAGGGDVIVTESYTADDSDFSAILTKVADVNPDVLYLPDYYSTVNLIAGQAQERGIQAALLGGDGWDSADLDRSVVEGGYFTNHFSPDDTRPIVQDFVSKYEAEYGSTPDALAALAYDAANILLQSMEAANSTDPAEVAAAMESGTFPVVSGDISYDAQHNPVKAAVVLHVQNGEIVYTDTVAP
ncbi:MAG: ABC transporter substrate-binding protein [Anaerolineae bacterium]|nr:ABC transporter substrate-binding protein [Anaerolineae bacterium]